MWLFPVVWCEPEVLLWIISRQYRLLCSDFVGNCICGQFGVQYKQWRGGEGPLVSTCGDLTNGGLPVSRMRGRGWEGVVGRYGPTIPLLFACLWIKRSGAYCGVQSTGR